MSMSAIKQFFVEADQGPLQVEFQEGQARLPVVILCHPHPLYGGSMHDGVLETAANTAQSLGLGWLRFNFRGVGASAGTHIPSADEPAETADLAAELRASVFDVCVTFGGLPLVLDSLILYGDMQKRAVKGG